MLKHAESHQSHVRPPTVLHARCVTGSGGGPDKTILNSPRFLALSGYQSICAFLHPPHDKGFSNLRHRAKTLAAPICGVPDRGAFDYRAARQIIELCREKKVAVWHGHDYKSNALGILANQFWPMKLISTVHGWVEHTAKTPIFYRIDKLCLRYYDEVICVSEDLYEECLRLGVRQSRCHLVHNGIDVEDFRRTRTTYEARASLPFEARGMLIGAMGRLSDEKGFGGLIRAVAQLVDEGQDISLWIAGEGAARGKLEDLVRDLGKCNRMHLLGHVDDPKGFYEAIDVFALSSLREGLPNVLLEAMALETPVLATRIAGIPSLISDGENGILVEPKSVDALLAGLRLILDSQSERDRLARNGRVTIERSFSFQQRMEKVVEIYDRLLERNHPIPESVPV